MTEEQIIEYYKDNRKYFLVDNNYGFTISKNNPPVGILVAVPKIRLLGIPRYQETLDALRTFNTDTRYTFYQPDQQELKVNMQYCWTVVFNKNKKQWVYDHNLPTYEDVEYYTLIAQKIFLLDTINNEIEIQTYEYNKRMPYQNYLNFHKYREACRILEMGLESDDMLQYPSVSLYARELGISIQHAAKEIKFKIDCDISFLSEIDAMRKKYEILVQNETDYRKLPNILSEFQNQHSSYSIFNS